MENINAETLKRFTTWTFHSRYDQKNAVMEQIKKDLAGKASILELLRRYMEELRSNPDNNAVPFSKMAKLFEYGLTPDVMEGHFYGVTLCLRTGDQEEPLASFGNVLEVLWGATLDEINPWTGKSLTPMTDAERDALTGGAFRPEGKAFRGINHFHKIELKTLNVLSFHLMDLWIGLEPAPKEEQKNYGYEKNGGNFIAAKGRSVYHDTNREVFQLNYRWKNLNNRAPLRWLIDEMVQVAEGLYLGQLLFSTKLLLKDYDPECPAADYDYQHFGYFVLLDTIWSTEARRLFPYLGVSASNNAQEPC